MAEGIDALTDKEKETLRLMLQGHDAKSMARTLDLSVHTINDRLRAARRKLSVTSSREAARLLAEAEGPQKLVPKALGGAGAGDPAEGFPPSNGRHLGVRPPADRRGWIIGGIALMTLVLAIALATATANQAPPADSPPEQVALDHATESAAREWLALVDARDWQASYDAAGSAFQAPNTVATWRAASQQARVPLGDVRSREAIGYQAVNAPPNGYRVVQFRSDFAQREGVTESVTLEREDGAWKVVGYFIS